MRVICKAVYEWGGTGSTPSFSLTVQEGHSILLLILACAREKWVQGPKGAKAHIDLVCFEQ